MQSQRALRSQELSIKAKLQTLFLEAFVAVSLLTGLLSKKETAYDDADKYKR
jgi:hypothetical protein